MRTAFLLVALVVGCSAVEEAKNRPVSKVVTLLKDMSNQLDKEAENDEETYDQMACWCSTNDKEKTKSIANGQQRSVDLSAAIEDGEAQSARLNSEIKQANADIAKNTNALDTATALRQQQLDEFNAEEKEMLSSTAALKSAVTVIGKHHEALLQGGTMVETAQMSTGLAKAAVSIAQVLRKNTFALLEVVTPSDRKTLDAFMHQLGVFVNVQEVPSKAGLVAVSQKVNADTPMNAGSYAPQSGAVFGILKNMKESFENNMAKSQKEETDNQAAYEDLKKAKNAQIAAAQVQVQEKSTALGVTVEKLANDRQDLEDTQNILAADQSFLANLKEKCEMFDADFEQRQKTRTEEIQAVSKAMAILSGDAAHDLFTKTFNPAALIQKAKSSVRREQAAVVLLSAAKRMKNPRLSVVAMKIRLSGLGAVKDSLQGMIEKLDQEKEDEIKLKDFCIDEFNTNAKNTELKDRDKEGLVAKIDDLTSTIDTLTTAINELKAEITEEQLQMKKAGEEREAQNREFQSTVADQRATQTLLTEALNVLKGFYDKKAALLAAQQKTGVVAEPAGPPPPADFKPYENNAASGGVQGMIQQIISDAKAMESDAIKAEEEAQEAYEGFVTDTNNSIEEKSRDLVNKDETRSQAEADKAEATTNLDAAMRDLEYFANEKSDLHSQCDFTLNNFDVRQTARDEEIEALKQSIAILSGANADMAVGFMQKKH